MGSSAPSGTLRDVQPAVPHARPRRVRSRASRGPLISDLVRRVDRGERKLHPSRRPRSARAAATVTSSDTIAPPSGLAPINRPRSAASRSPSSSENTPAAVAATSSPRLCPRTAARFDAPAPVEIVERVLQANSAGCATSVRPVHLERRASEQRRAVVDHIPDDGLPLVERPAHTGVLRTLTRE